MIEKRLEVWPIDKIVPYENNPRKNDQAVPDVVESIKQCENLDPIEVDENGVILSGHTRLKALKQLEYEKTEVLVYTGLTEEQKRKYRLLANKTGEKAEWEFAKLEEELENLDFGDFDFGFEDASLPPVPENLNADTDYSGEEPIAIKLTFLNYAEYSQYEGELKEIAERMGADFAIVKA